MKSLNKMKLNIKLGLLLLISSCTTIDTNKIAPGYVEAFTSIRQLIVGYEDNIKPELINNIPYASMLVKIGRGPTALMILEKINEDEYTWVSADGVYLVIKNGRIIKTFGLSNNLQEKLTTLKNWKRASIHTKDFTSYYSFKQPELNNLKVISSFNFREIEKVELMFGPKDLKLIEENIVSDEIGWFATNKYWIDRNDHVWKSVQYISPRLPAFYIEVTKKPR